MIVTQVSPGSWTAEQATEDGLPQLIDENGNTVPATKMTLKILETGDGSGYAIPKSATPAPGTLAELERDFPNDTPEERTAFQHMIELTDGTDRAKTQKGDK
jgi:hypothetical protein